MKKKIKTIPKKTKDWLRKQEKMAEKRFGEKPLMNNKEAVVLINQMIGFVWKDYGGKNLIRLGEWTKKFIK